MKSSVKNPSSHSSQSYKTNMNDKKTDTTGKQNKWMNERYNKWTHRQIVNCQQFFVIFFLSFANYLNPSCNVVACYLCLLYPSALFHCYIHVCSHCSCFATILYYLKTLSDDDYYLKLYYRVLAYYLLELLACRL